MSATIYALPKEFEVKVPSVWDYNEVPYGQREQEFLEELKLFLIENNDEEFVGEIIKFPVADGHAQYMVCGLKPLELLHLPLIDGYEAMNVDLLTAKRVKEMIVQNRNFKAFLKKQSTATDEEVKEAIKLVGIDSRDLSEDEFNKLEKEMESIGLYKYFLIEYNSVKYFIPIYSPEQKYEHRVYKFLYHNYGIKK